LSKEVEHLINEIAKYIRRTSQSSIFVCVYYYAIIYCTYCSIL